jgi:phage-related protein
MEDKAVLWLHSEGIKTPPFSARGRHRAGMLIRSLQQGDSLEMPDSRPMPEIGKRCHELRIRDGNVVWRIIYRIDHDAIILVEVFKKKTRSTPKQIVDVCRSRLAKYDEDIG